MVYSARKDPQSLPIRLRLNGQVMKDALVAGKSAKGALELLAENGGFFRTYALDYHSGPRWPVLERVAGTPDLLAEILKPTAK